MSTAVGSFKLPSGDVYQGQYIRNESNVVVPHGQGTLLLSSGDLFVGEFVDGKRVTGKVLYHTGSTYEGLYDASENLSGSGLYRWPDGRLYRGFFLNGRPHGPGVYEGFVPSSSETVFSGISVNGAFASLTQPDFVARFLAQYEAEFLEAARAHLRALSSDLDALIPGGSSDANAQTPAFIAKHLLLVDAAPADPWVAGGLATDAVKGTAFVTLRQLRLRIPAIRKLLERPVSVRCLQSAPSWGLEQMRGFAQVLEIVEPEITLRFVNVSNTPGAVALRLAEATGEVVPDEGAAIAAIFNEKKKKK